MLDVAPCRVSTMISATRLPTAFKRCFDHSCHNMYPTADLGLVSACGNLNPTAQTAHRRRCPLYSRRYFVVPLWPNALFPRPPDVVPLVGIGSRPPRPPHPP